MLTILSCSERTVNNEIITIDLDDEIELIMDHWKAPGVILTVVKDGEVLVNKGYGTTKVEGEVPLTSKTMATVASVSKTFNSVVFAMLAEDSLLTWDDPVIQHIPEFKFVDEYRSQHTTIRDLITHRSGLPSVMGDFWTTEYTIENLLNDLPNEQATIGFREEINYSQVGIALMGEIVSRVTNSTYQKFITSRILDPLDMKDTYPGASIFLNVYPNPEDLPNLMGRAEWKNEQLVNGTWRGANDLYTPPAGMITTGDDMTKYMLFLLNGGRINGEQLLTNQSIETLYTPQLVDRGFVTSFVNPNAGILSYCLGWYAHEYKGAMVVEHPGASFGSSVIALIPEKGIGVFVSSNANYSPDSNRMVGAIKFAAIDYALGVAGNDWIEIFSNQ
jgi:CubicO group peptidase (beta-lactamase class C family)